MRKGEEHWGLGVSRGREIKGEGIRSLEGKREIIDKWFKDRERKIYREKEIGD